MKDEHKKAGIGKFLKDLNVFVKGDINVYNPRRSKATVGLSHNKLNLGEAGISYDGTKNGNKLEIYYKPSSLVKSLGYAAPIYFGLLFGGDVYRTVPEPYKVPATIVGALLFTFITKKSLDFLFKH